MTTKLTYNQFRSAHKGTPRQEISNLWSLYKEGEYSFPAEEPSEIPEKEVIEEATVSESDVKEEPPKEEKKTNKLITVNM